MPTMIVNHIIMGSYANFMAEYHYVDVHTGNGSTTTQFLNDG